MNYRSELKNSHIPVLKEILVSTGFFYDFEVEVAIEIAVENLEKGEEKSGYIFLVAEEEGNPVGFASYGKTPCTLDSFDLYWMAVHQSKKGSGIGKIMMKMVEENVAKLGGKNIWIETSSRPLYEPTRMFYLKTGSELIAELPHFYGPNDNKVIFLKKV